MVSRVSSFFMFGESNTTKSKNTASFIVKLYFAFGNLNVHPPIVGLLFCFLRYFLAYLSSATRPTGKGNFPFRGHCCNGAPLVEGARRISAYRYLVFRILSSSVSPQGSTPRGWPSAFSPELFLSALVPPAGGGGQNVQRAREPTNSLSNPVTHLPRSPIPIG